MGTQTIAFGAAPSLAVGGTNALTATGGGSGNPVTFTSQTAGVCTTGGTDGSTVTGLTAGTCTIAADQVGNANYGAAPQVIQPITVEKGTQTIAFGTAPSVVVGSTGTLTANGGSAGNSATFSSQTTMVNGLAVGTAVNCFVTVGTDDGTGGTPGTLSWAIMTANNGTTPSTPYQFGHPGGGCTNNTITLTTDVTVTGVMTRLIDSNVTLQSDATTRTISGGNSYRPLFVKSGTVTIKNLNLDNGRAQGGDGKYGGAGAGLGGALFIYTGTVMVENVGFTGNRAQGGRGQGGAGFNGGGGMFGNSDSGGGGLFGNGSGNLGGYGGTGAYGGHGGIGGTNGFGGFGGGGYASPSGGGYGGFGGGGGFGRGPGFEAGNFGGGGGASGGGGGFGGGGGKRWCSFCGYGSFGGGFSGAVFGGGGAGFGGAVFVKRGTLSLKNASFTGNTATGGTSEQSGQGKGGAIFICTSDLDSNNAPNGARGGCSGSIDEAASYGVTFSGGAATEGQPDLFWTQASGGAHNTAGITDNPGLATHNPVTFSSQTTGVCATGGTNGSTVTGLTAGTCIVAADQAGNANYNAAAQVTQNLSIGKGTQSVAFGTLPSVIVGGTGTLSATGGASGNPVTFSSQTAGVCTLSGSTVTGVTAGTCTVTADQAGNANYNAAAQVTQNLSIGKGTQSVAFGTLPSVVVGGTGTLSATGGASGNPVTFSSQTAGVCTVSGSTVIGVTAGTCTIAANQAGNASYKAAAQVTQNLSIGKGTQSIAFGTLPSVVVGGAGTLSATGGASGNPVMFTSQTIGVCTTGGTNGSTVTGVAAGTCTIAANQLGNTNYNAAPQTTQSFAIGSFCWECLPNRGGWRAILP